MLRSAILLLPTIALAGRYSGTVKDLSGSPLAGATVAIGADSAISDAEGKWSLASLSGRLHPGRATIRGMDAGSWKVIDGRLAWGGGGFDIQGRRIVHPLPPALQGPSAAARSAAVSDTLVVSWNGKRLVRLPVSMDSAGIGLAIDTAWSDDFDIPWNPRVVYGSVKDSLGRTYRTVKMDTRTWMAENLATTGLDKQGDSLGLCNERSLDSCRKYGRLYTWPEALVVDSFYNHQLLNTNRIRRRGVCPQGWLVPTENEWIELLDWVDPRRENDARLLRSTRGWVKNGTKPGNGTDAFGFRVLAASFHTTTYFQTAGTSSTFWTLTEDVLTSTQRASSPFFTYVALYTLMDDPPKPYSASLRCVKEAP